MKILSFREVQGGVDGKHVAIIRIRRLFWSRQEYIFAAGFWAREWRWLKDGTWIDVGLQFAVEAAQLRAKLEAKENG